jgi:hypothetical protein
MVKPTKVKYDKSDDCRSDEEEDYSKDELIEICEQLSIGYKKKKGVQSIAKGAQSS